MNSRDEMGKRVVIREEFIFEIHILFVPDKAFRLLVIAVHITYGVAVVYMRIRRKNSLQVG